MNNFEFEHNGKKLWYSRSLAVSCIVYTHNDVTGATYILANKRGQGCEFNKGLWNMPGGFIDFDETAEGAATRECFEETGVTISPNDWKFVDLDTNYSQSARQTIIARYSVEIPYITAAKMNFTNEYSEPEEVEEIKWINVEELDKYKWTKRQVEAIEKFIKQLEYDKNN